MTGTAITALVAKTSAAAVSSAAAAASVVRRSRVQSLDGLTRGVRIVSVRPSNAGNSAADCESHHGAPRSRRRRSRSLASLEQTVDFSDSTADSMVSVIETARRDPRGWSQPSAADGSDGTDGGARGSQQHRSDTRAGAATAAAAVAAAVALSAKERGEGVTTDGRTSGRSAEVWCRGARAATAPGPRDPSLLLWASHLSPGCAPSSTAAPYVVDGPYREGCSGIMTADQKTAGDFHGMSGKFSRGRGVVSGRAGRTSLAAVALSRGARITEAYVFDGGEEEVVGRGNRGTVSSATHRFTGQPVAVKRLPREHTTRLEVMAEVSMLKLAGEHPNVVTLQAFFEDEDAYYIVMDLCQGGELYHRLADKGRYSEGQAARIMAEVADAVAYLHGQGIVHFDLKPENIMLAVVGDECVPEVRLADFGSAFRQHSRVFGARDYTAAYSAPEVLARQPVDEKADMWALGVVMWVVLTGRHPFNPNRDLTDDEIMRRIVEEEPDLKARGTRHVSPEGKDLVRRLLAKSPADRPSAAQMLAHPWLRAVMRASEGRDMAEAKRAVSRLAANVEEKEVAHAARIRRTSGGGRRDEGNAVTAAAAAGDSTRGSGTQDCHFLMCCMSEPLTTCK